MESNPSFPMIRILLILLIVPSLATCQSKPFTVEDKLFDCAQAHFEQEGIDLLALMERGEKGLLADSVFMASVPQGLIDYLERVKAENNLPALSVSEETKATLVQLAKLTPPVACSPEALGITPEDLKASRFGALLSAMDKLRSETNINPSLVASTYLEALTAEDLNHPIFRFGMLTFFARFNEVGLFGEGIQRRLPPPLEEKVEPDSIPRNIIHVAINGKDEIFLDGNPVKIDEILQPVQEAIQASWEKGLRKKVVPHIGMTKVANYTLIMTNDNGTSYERYIKVQNELAAAITEVREVAAQRIFATPYVELPLEKQAAIGKVIPNHVEEKNPE